MYFCFIGFDRLIMKKSIRLLLIPFSLLAMRPLIAQTVNPSFKIQQERKLWHENIDREQKRLLALDGKPDEFIQATKDDNINLQIADVMIRQVDLLQQKIEMDSTLSGTDEDQISPVPGDHDPWLQ